MASDDDEIARLLREVESVTGSSGTQPNAPTPATRGASKEVAEDAGSSGARARWVALAAVGGGVLGVLAGTILALFPGISPLGTGIGAAFGAAIAALVGGPPRWLQ